MSYNDVLEQEYKDSISALYALVADVAPLAAVAAFKGGSMFYKQWVDRARELGIEIADPTINPVEENPSERGELE